MAIKDWNGFKKSGDTYIPNDATARAGVTATVDLLRDTTGWVSKNKNYHNAQTSTAGTVTFTVNTNKSVALSGTTTTAVIKDLRTYTGAELKALGSKLVLSGGDAKAYLAIRTSNYTFIARSFGDAVEFDTSTLEDATTYYETIGVSVPSGSSVDLTGVVIYPMITTPEEYKLSPTYEPYHESVEDWYWSENAKTGAHNIFNPALFLSSANANMATVNSDGSSIRVKTETAGTYRLCAWYLNVTPNTDYTVKTSVAITSGKCGIKVETVGDTNIKMSNVLSDDGDIEMTFNSGNNTKLKFDIFCTWVVSEVGDVTCNNLFIKETADTYNNFLPFAMTNMQLTESLKYRNVQLKPVPNTGTNYEKVVNIAEQLDALITDVGVKFSGYVLWTQSMFLRVEAMRCNATTLLYTIFNVSNTIYNGAVQNGAVTVYKFEGTQMTS